MKKIKVAVLGAGNFGTAISQLIASNGHKVYLWNWEGDLLPLRQIKKSSENKKYLPGVKLSKNIMPTEKIFDALAEAEIVFFAVPSGVFTHTLGFAARNIKNDSIIVDLSKGLEPKSLKMIPDILAKHLKKNTKKNIVSVSGPAIAGQLARGVFTTMNIASKNKKAMEKVMSVMCNKNLKLLPTSDIVGVEVGGSFKNVYSIAMGICDAMGMGLNTKSGLIAFAIDEISKLTVAMGGKKETVFGLAGLGDLVGTALCEESRNRRFGEYLGSGLKTKQAVKKVGQTVEGIDAVYCLMKLKNKYKLKLPFAEAVYACIKTTGDPRKKMESFLQSIKCDF
ncbi:MAG: NAD(P)H-dependent glycerol-3-phosphate dehydrogenase [Candidatus Magasanikbacteria bacterium]|nr:NAD(P)H-dependent glycerol-3-phosphate dehydrogenase [Candidatus Magasanikbacteria bacterium]